MQISRVLGAHPGGRQVVLRLVEDGLDPGGVLTFTGGLRDSGAEAQVTPQMEI